MDRKTFIRRSALASAGVTLGADALSSALAGAEVSGIGFDTRQPVHGADGNPASDRSSRGSDESLTIPAVDTNVTIGSFPFRTFKYNRTDAITRKLQAHNVGEAWTGSYESLFHKNIDAVNRRLFMECSTHGEGLLIPFGTVNPAYPDWEEDLRRCSEEYGMRGIRLYPAYHGYTQESDSLRALIRQAIDRDLLVQIVIGVVDPRMEHPLLEVGAVDPLPLIDHFEREETARIQLLHPFYHLRLERLERMVHETDVLFDISNLDATGSLRMIMDGDHLYRPGLRIPAGRLMMGSHMPLFPLENALFKFMESPLSSAEAGAILAGNAHRMMGREMETF